MDKQKGNAYIHTCIYVYKQRKGGKERKTKNDKRDQPTNTSKLQIPTQLNRLSQTFQVQVRIKKNRISRQRRTTGNKRQTINSDQKERKKERKN